MNKMICCLACVLVTFHIGYTQVYEVIINNSHSRPGKGIVQFGTNTSKSGQTVSAGSYYFIKNGRPWFPVMGEIHFSRYPREQWEPAILKMKAAGIDIIASYIFWIHHEEKKGVYNWTGNNDLRYFVELCKKHQVFFFPRIGPWCHGEARNGGFPDWLLSWKGLRSNDTNYLQAVAGFYDQIAQQLKGLYFKDDGPVIGTQIENEYNFASEKGYRHLLALKQLAVKAGIDVPYYTATGWPASNQKQGELIPVWGAYPEAPWDPRTTELEPDNSYLFGPITSDPRIGNDIIAGEDRANNDFKNYPYPFATAEMGGGNQVTYHRRPIIKSNDVTALAYTKLGCGGNLLGYYMFHGGSHPLGKWSTMQESKASGYPSDYPVISYDFFAPIGEWGQLRPSYHQFRRLHTFLNDFGHLLAPAHPYFPEIKPKGPTDSTVLRFAVRSHEQKGFVVISNYQRKVNMKDFPGVRFSLRFAGDSLLQFPQTPITIKSGVQAIFPFNLQMGDVQLRYATAHLFCKLGNTYVFTAVDGIDPEFSFDMQGIKSINAKPLHQNNHVFVFDRKKPVNWLHIKTVKNELIKIMIVSPEYATQVWKGNGHVFITPNQLEFSPDKIDIKGSGPLKLKVYPDKKTYTFKVKPEIIKVVSKKLTHITASNNPYPSGMKYQPTLQPIDGARYWAITVPPHDQDIFLSFDYTGDIGALYKDGRLIADDFFCGEPMQVGLNKSKDSTRFVFLTLPLLPTTNIYLEPGIREKIDERQQGLKAVRAIPQYKATLRIK